jgi:hypothetical protein
LGLRRPLRSLGRRPTQLIRMGMRLSFNTMKWKCPTFRLMVLSNKLLILNPLTALDLCSDANILAEKRRQQRVCELKTEKMLLKPTNRSANTVPSQTYTFSLQVSLQRYRCRSISIIFNFCLFVGEILEYWAMLPKIVNMTVDE